MIKKSDLAKLSDESLCIFYGQNLYDSNPFSSVDYEFFHFSKIEDYIKKFNAPIEDKLDKLIYNKTHYIYDSDAFFFNDGAIKVFEKYDPDHWSNDDGGIMGNVIFFTKPL